MKLRLLKIGYSQTGRNELCILVHFEYESFWRGDYLTEGKLVREIILSKILEKRIVWVGLN
jgi:hypothetical protein